MKYPTALIFISVLSLGLAACGDEGRPTTNQAPVTPSPDPTSDTPYDPGVDQKAKEQAYLPGAEDPSEIPAPNQPED